MKLFKSVLALALSVATVLTLSACHPKDEVAVTVTDEKSGISTTLTTAQYIYAYTNAVLEANSNIDENKDDDKEITDYSKYKITETDENGKETKTEYEKWVNNRAEELIRDYAAADIKQKALKIKIDEDNQNSIDSYSAMYWQYYYQPIFEKNGVGYETYKKMFTGSYYQNEYFLSIYDTDGTDPVAEKTVSNTFYDSYCLADTLTISVAEESSEEDSETEDSESLTLSEAKKLLKGYKTRIEKGETFANIFKEYNEENSTEEESTTEADSTTVYGSEETDSASEYFTEVFKLKTDDVKILTNEDESEIILVQKKDISNDEETYYKSYRESVLHQLKDDEFSNNFKKFAKSLKLEKNKSATKRVKIKKIDVSTESAETTAE